MGQSTQEERHGPSPRVGVRVVFGQITASYRDQGWALSDPGSQDHRNSSFFSASCLLQDTALGWTRGYVGIVTPVIYFKKRSFMHWFPPQMSKASELGQLFSRLIDLSFILKAQGQRGEREAGKEKSSVHWFTPQTAVTAGSGGA